MKGSLVEPGSRRSHRAARLSRVALAALVLFAAPICSSSPVEERFAKDPELNRLIDDLHAESVALDLGRLKYRKSWEALQTEALYLIAVRGSWDENHPAWAAARHAVGEALRRESVAWLAQHRDTVREVVDAQTMQHLDEEERRQATQFFESPGGRVWQARRESVLHKLAYGLPFLIETESLAELTAVDAKAEAALLALPEDGDGKVVFDFFESPAGKKLLKMQIEDWAEILPNVWGNDLRQIVHDKRAELAAAVRAAVPGIPPPSDKTYLGTVTMKPDRGFKVTIEFDQTLESPSTYVLEFAPGDMHWPDIAAAVPGIAPGATRPIYRDAAGKLGDKP